MSGLSKTSEGEWKNGARNDFAFDDKWGERGLAVVAPVVAQFSQVE
jgi:hypothetical protein